MTNLETLIAQRFIARRDVKAVQAADGGYRPVRTPWSLPDLTDHLAGRRTYGHYLLNEHNQCKFFAFDCDLNDADGAWVQQADLSQLPENAFTGEHAEHYFEHNTFIHGVNPRQAWRDRAHPARGWLKFQMRSLAELLSSAIHKHLQIPVVCTYTGNKGIHVYGLTGLMPAKDVREAARLILAATGRFTPSRGDNFFIDTSTPDWRDSFANFTIEVFPKQDTVDPGHFGNLMRVPFGRNLKNSVDPTFVIDQRLPHTTLAPHPDPLAALISGDPWRLEHEAVSA